MIGETVSHYRVIRRLGAGGSGEVYLAEDERLGRKVALKLLPRTLACDGAAKSRLVREARTASLLDHPHICTVFDIDELPTGELLLAMAYCDGETLRARMLRGPLPPRDAAELACQIAEALAEAHANGIIHRDVKPANVMLTKGGQVKLVDFGLARAREPSSVTATGEAVGTPAYMAPEQVRGETVDGRADLWALGAILYEMLAGRPAFPGESVQAVLYGVVHRAPEPLDRLRPGLPPALVRVVNRALAKDRLGRYQQAEQMLADLCDCRERIDAGTTSATNGAGLRVPSIAVLPFANLSADPEQQYFCEGMTEELITTLGTIDGLRVAARTSSFHAKRKDLDIPTIGRHLHVETLLEGSVRRAGDRLRVTAQLVNASDGYHLWSARFDRRIDDVFTVQDEITRAIVENLKGRLLTPKDMPVVRRATSDMAAYQLYLKGRYHFARRYQGGLERAVECFSNAIERDPGSASALAGLADALSLEGFYGLGPPRRLLARARGAAERAIALEGSLPEAHHALGMVHLWMDWNWEAVDRAFRRALQLDPNAPLSRAYYALSLAIMGFGERAEREAEEATGLDPLSALTWNVAASTCFMLRRYGAAIESGRRAYDLDPGFLPASWVLGLAFSAAGRHEEAIEAADRGGRMTGRAPFFLGILGHALGRAGRRSAAARVLEELRERSRTGYVSPIQFAVVHDGLGEVEEGLAVLERGMADWGGAYVLPLASPAYDTLRGHPRFAEMLRSAGYVGPWASSDGARRAGHREENPSGGRIAGGNGD